MNVNLGDVFEKFVTDLVASGEYQSQSEVVREGLRLLKEREELRRIRLEELRREVRKGLDEFERGEGIILSTPEEQHAFFQGITRRGQERLAQKKKRKHDE